MAPLVALAVLAFGAALAGLGGVRAHSSGTTGSRQSLDSLQSVNFRGHPASGGRSHQSNPNQSLESGESAASSRAASLASNLGLEESDFESGELRRLREEFVEIHNAGLDDEVAADFKERNIFDAVRQGSRRRLFEELLCRVCLELLTSNSFRKLACGHVFHEQCYRGIRGPATAYTRRCPLCNNTGPHVPHAPLAVWDTVLSRTLRALEAHDLNANNYRVLPPEDNYSLHDADSPLRRGLNLLVQFGRLENDDRDYLKWYLNKIFRFAQHVVEAAIKDVMAVNPWFDGFHAGIKGDNADVRRSKLNDVRYWADCVYHLLTYEEGIDEAPRKSIELTRSPLDRERTILSLLHILVSVTEPPILNALWTLESDDLSNLARWKEVVAAVRSLVVILASHIGPSPVVGRDAEKLSVLAMSFVDYVESNFMHNTLESSAEMLVEFPHLLIAPGRFEPVWPSREFAAKSVGDRLESLFCGAAGVLHNIAYEQPATSAIYFYPDEVRLGKLLYLHRLVSDAVPRAGAEAIEPVPQFPQVFSPDFGELTIREYLKAIQISLFRSLLADLPSAVPVQFPPLYPGTADIGDPHFAQMLEERLLRVKAVVEFATTHVSGSNTARQICVAFIQATEEVFADLRLFASWGPNFQAIISTTGMNGIHSPAFEAYSEIAALHSYDMVSPELFF